MQKKYWRFEDYIEEIIHLSEITEVPGITEAREVLLTEVWHKFPAECRALGLTDNR
jgi:hypothetical protein